MITFIMLTRLSPDAVQSPQALEQLERNAMERVRKDCPDVEWVSNYAILVVRVAQSDGVLRVVFSCDSLPA